MNRSIGTRESEVPQTGLRGLFARIYGQRRRGATIAAAMLTLGVGYHVVFGQNGLTAYEQKLQDARSLDQHLKMLSAENERLEGHVARLQSDPGSIEHEAREQLHYTRPGEVIVQLPNEKAATSINENLQQ